MAKPDRTKGGSKELLIEIDSFEQSYHIADHRAEIGRVDDEAIIDIRGKIVRTSDHRPLTGAPAELSLVCSQSYHAATDASDAQLPMLMTASHVKGRFKALGYLPPEPFWALPEMISSGRVSHVIVDYLGRVDKRDSQLLRVLIQDCFLRSSHESRGFIRWGLGTDRAAAAA